MQLFFLLTHWPWFPQTQESSRLAARSVSEDTQRTAAPLRRSSQFHAVLTISFRPRVAFHCNSDCALAGSATRAGGSPGRRGAILWGTLLPVIFSTAEITSCTEAPVPVPTLTAKLSLPNARCSRAFT